MKRVAEAEWYQEVGPGDRNCKADFGARNGEATWKGIEEVSAGGTEAGGRVKEEDREGLVFQTSFSARAAVQKFPSTLPVSSSWYTGPTRVPNMDTHMFIHWSQKCFPGMTFCPKEVKVG